MTPEEFVDVLRKVVLEPSVDGTLAAVERPPGRRPHVDLVEASAWFKTLSDEDRASLRKVAALVAHATLFGVLAVIDGVRVVESTPEKGEFKLTFSKNGQQWDLNPADGMYLHDLLNTDSES